jgi:hypothetical protein
MRFSASILEQQALALKHAGKCGAEVVIFHPLTLISSQQILTICLLKGMMARAC